MHDSKMHEKHEFVDLGLPSGLQWATTNLGANSPDEFGNYYAWGEVQTKESYTLDNYKWWKNDGLTKYCTDRGMGKVDNKTLLDMSDDAARVHCGGNWRMPTLKDIQELIDNCSWEWATVNGVSGYKVTGSNGNSIFWPLGGTFVGSESFDKDEIGCYWLASLDDVNYGDEYAYSMQLDRYGYSYRVNERTMGFLIRPVCNVTAKGKEEQKCKVTISSAGYGNVSMPGKTGTKAMVVKGETITVVANAYDGAEFVGWYVKGSNKVVSSSAIYDFAVKKDIDLVARFEKPDNFSVTEICDGRGTVYIDEASDTPVESEDNKQDTQLPLDLVARFEMPDNFSVTAICDGRGTVYIDGASYMPVESEDNKQDTQLAFKDSQVAVGVVPEEDTEFVGWFRAGSSEPVSKELMYVFTVSEDIVLTAVCVDVEKVTVSEDIVLTTVCVDVEKDKRAVDLGLSVCWASCNIGATCPEEEGTIFAWGEIDEKGYYEWDNYKYCNYDRTNSSASDSVSPSLWDENFFISKYSPEVDNLRFLDEKDDAASVNWGGAWRMPTELEVHELIEYCHWEWTILNDVEGYKVKGPNGNSIFLPVDQEKSYGLYWLKGCVTNIIGKAWAMSLGYGGNGLGGQSVGCIDRCIGLPIRAVCNSENYDLFERALNSK